MAVPPLALPRRRSFRRSAISSGAYAASHASPMTGVGAPNRALSALRRATSFSRSSSTRAGCSPRYWQAGLAGQVDDLADCGNAGAAGDFEFALAEGRGDLVLHHLHTRLVADRLLAVLHHAGLADVEPHAGVELQCVATGRCLRVAVHHANLLSKLVATPNVDKRGFGSPLSLWHDEAPRAYRIGQGARHDLSRWHQHVVILSALFFSPHGISTDGAFSSSTIPLRRGRTCSDQSSCDTPLASSERP